MSLSLMLSFLDWLRKFDTSTPQYWDPQFLEEFSFGWIQSLPCHWNGITWNRMKCYTMKNAVSLMSCFFACNWCFYFCKGIFLIF